MKRRSLGNEHVPPALEGRFTEGAVLCTVASLFLFISFVAVGANLPPPEETPLLSVPSHGKLKPLFNGRNFDGFDTLLKDHGIDIDPNHVFSIEDGVLHISGEEFGGLVTKNEYENYYLRAEFKWGEKTYAPRIGTARDSGIQYNITGPNKVWPRMMEFQINEGGTGDMWVVNGTGIMVNGVAYESTVESGPKQYIRIAHLGRGPLVNTTGHRDPVNDLEKPHGEWNVLELVVDGDRILYLVNGKLALTGVGSNTTRGKILFQCEGSEVYFRKMSIAHLN